jgi:hypothetical protein
MKGQPVWLASISRRSALHPSKAISTQLWPKQARDEAEAHLLRLLGPAGNPARERLFRMQVTMCLHRALTDEEVDAAGSALRTDPPTDLAGGPVEILRETEDGLETTKPCHHPIRQVLDRRAPLLWLPYDCGTCPPCQARSAVQDERDRVTGAAPTFLAGGQSSAGSAR